MSVIWAYGKLSIPKGTSGLTLMALPDTTYNASLGLAQLTPASLLQIIGISNFLGYLLLVCLHPHSFISLLLISHKRKLPTLQAFL